MLGILVYAAGFTAVFVWAIAYGFLAIRRYASARKQARLAPSEAAEKELKKETRRLIFDLLISGALLSVIAYIVVFIIRLLSMPMTNM